MAFSALSPVSFSGKCAVETLSASDQSKTPWRGAAARRRAVARLITESAQSCPPRRRCKSGTITATILFLAIVAIGFGAGTANAAAPIAAGEHRQLFIDNHLIGSFRNLKRVAHRPAIHPGNPIFTGTEPWERWLVGVNGNCVMFDSDSQEFKMWYSAYSDDPGDRTRVNNSESTQQYRVCYAVSKDGLHWSRPVLGQVDWEGSRQNNIVGTGENWMRRPNIIKDENETDPARRYKMTYVDVIGGKSAIAKAHSADGVTWRLNADGKPWFTTAYNANLLGWDDRRREYVLLRRVTNLQHSIGRSVSTDFVNWSEPKVVLSPGPAELDKNFQGLAAFFYEGVCFGFLSVRDQPRLFYNSELALSRDGVEWHRFSPGNLFLAKGGPGTWNYEAVIAVAPVVYGDEIRIYFTGTNYLHSGASLGPVQRGWIENGLRIQSAIGLATLRLDGFVSLEAGTEPGTITTKTLAATGELRVNANVRGELRVALLDGAGKSVPGLSTNDCEPIRSDGIRHVVRWNGKTSAQAQPGGKPCRLQFTLRDANLYSFHFAR